jgi:hypothetical protein
MSVTVANIIAGPATMYGGVFGATEPLDTAINSTPGAGWADLGGTNDGVNITINQDFLVLEVDQIVDEIGRRLTKRSVQVKTNLAEGTLANVQLALFNGGAISTGAGFAAYDPANDNSATQPNYTALLLDGYAPSGFRRRFVLRKILSIDNVGMDYKKDGQTLVPVTFAAHYVSSSIRPFRIVDQTS